MSKFGSGPCIAKVSTYGHGQLHITIPSNMLHKFSHGMKVEVIEVRKKTVIAEGKI